MATRRDCQHALAQHEAMLSRLPGVVGLGIVAAAEGAADGDLAVALYVQGADAAPPVPARLPVATPAGDVVVPVRVILQGRVDLEPGG